MTTATPHAANQCQSRYGIPSRTDTVQCALEPHGTERMHWAIGGNLEWTDAEAAPPVAQPAPTAEGGKLDPLAEAIALLEPVLDDNGTVDALAVASAMHSLYQVRADHAAQLDERARSFGSATLARQKAERELESLTKNLTAARSERDFAEMKRDAAEMERDGAVAREKEAAAVIAADSERIHALEQERDAAIEAGLALENCGDPEAVCSKCMRCVKQSLVVALDREVRLGAERDEARAEVERLANLRAEWDAVFAGRSEFPDQEFSPENLRTVIRASQAAPAPNLGELRAKLENIRWGTAGPAPLTVLLDECLALLPAHDDRKTEAGR